MIESKLIDFKNQILSFFQDKLQFVTQNSFIIERIDDLIFLFITLTLILSTFMESEKIGAIAIIAVLLTVVKLFTQKGAKIALTSWDGAIIVYFLICGISVINSTLIPQSIHGFLKTVIYTLYYFSAANYFQTNKSKIKYVFALVAGLCFVESIIAIYQNFCGVEQISTWQDSNYINPEDAIARAYGTLKPLNPNLLGGYLVAGFSFVIGTGLLFLANKKYKQSLITLGALLICALAVFFTGSRGAYLGLGAVIAGFIAICSKIIWTDFEKAEKLKSIWKKVIIAICSSFVLILLAVPKILKRLLSIFILRGDSSTSFRMNVYNSSWQMFQDNWLLGIGTGNQTFREIYGLYMLTGYDALSTYSVPLEIAVESGIFALIAFVTFIVLFFIRTAKFIVTPNALSDKVIVSCAILTILGVMTHGMFDTIYFRPQVQFLFWTMIAMGSSILITCKNKEV